MSTISFTLPPEREAFVDSRVASGEYASAQDVFRTAFNLRKKRESLLAHIDEGTSRIRQGQFGEYGEGDRERFLSDVAAASFPLREPTK